MDGNELRTRVGVDENGDLLLAVEGHLEPILLARDGFFDPTGIPAFSKAIEITT